MYMGRLGLVGAEGSASPAGQILDPETMDKRGLLDGVREWSFLQNERLPAAVNASVAELDWAGAPGGAADGVTLLEREQTDGYFKRASPRNNARKFP